MRQLHILVIFTVILGSWNLDASAQNVNFPDANLAAKIRSALGLPTDADIPLTSLQGLTRLNGYNAGITDLTGLEHATSLTSLSLNLNSISDISPVSSLTNLTFLTFHKNYKINDIRALSGLTSLKTLALGYNEISNISSLSGLTNLIEFNIEYNQVRDISVMSNFTGLERSNLNSNPIVNFNPLSGLTSLRLLHLENTGIRDLSVLSNLTSLLQLSLRDNRITNLNPLSGLTDLFQLYLDRNGISNLSPLAGLTGLQFLYFSENRISDLSPLSGLTNLEKLNICWNEWSDISPLQTLAALTNFWIDNQFHLNNPGLLIGLINDPGIWPALVASKVTLCTVRPARPDPPSEPETSSPEPETSSPEPEPAVKQRRIIARCGLGWSPHSQYQHHGELPKVMIYALEFEYDPDSHGRYSCKTIEIRTGDDTIENLAGWNLYLGTLYNPSRIPLKIPEEHSQITGRILRITPEMLGLETFPCNTVNGISHPLPGVQYVLKTDENVLVDTAYSCFVWGQNAYTTVNGINVKSKRSISSAALREMETPRLERYILNNISVYITYMNIEAFTWDRAVLSDWLLAASELSAPGAPSAIQRKLVTTWGALKKQ